MISNSARGSILPLILGLCLAASVAFYARGDTDQTLNAAPSVEGTPSASGSIGTTPENFLQNIYLWFFGMIGIAAFFSIVRGGIMYMYAGGNSSRVEEARRHITNAFVGILIAGLSYLGLNVINPDLVRHGFNLKQIIEDALSGRASPDTPIDRPSSVPQKNELGP